MKEIKAFVHRNRVADIVHALRNAGYNTVSVIDVLGMLRSLDTQEQNYSTELGEKVIMEVKLELVCPAAQVDEAIALIRRHGRTGRPDAGWVYVSALEQALPITED